jgi:hypothetical protein
MRSDAEKTSAGRAYLATIDGRTLNHPREREAKAARETR